MPKSIPNYDSQLVQYRLQAGVTQAQLAEALGVTVQTVRNWENDRVKLRFSLPQLKILARVLKLELNEMRDGLDEAAKPPPPPSLLSRLAKRRKELGHTQSDLAQCLKVSTRAVQKWEAGEVLPYLSPTQFADMCNFMQCTYDELADLFREPTGVSADG